MKPALKAHLLTLVSAVAVSQIITAGLFYFAGEKYLNQKIADGIEIGVFAKERIEKQAWVDAQYPLTVAMTALINAQSFVPSTARMSAGRNDAPSLCWNCRPTALKASWWEVMHFTLDGKRAFPSSAMLRL